MKITSATIESVADTGAMFYLLQAPAEAATNAGEFFKKEKSCKRIDAYSFAVGGGRAAYPASQIPYKRSVGSLSDLSVSFMFQQPLMISSDKHLRFA